MAVKTPAPQRAAGRRKLAAKGQALPGGEEPIPDLAYLRKAIRSVGRLDPSRRPALKALIIKRTRELKAANAKGVKGTWAFQGANEDEAVDLATMTRRMPLIRGAADIQMARTAPGTVTVRHKSTGMHIGTLKSVDNDGQWTATHAPTRAKLPKAPSMQGALSSLIAHHNRKAKLPPAQSDGTAVMPGAGPVKATGYANSGQQALDFAGALPVTSASDGPRMTAMSGGKKTGSNAPVKLSAKLQLSPEAAAIFSKLRKKGLSPKAALAMARSASAMHAKAAAKGTAAKAA